MARGEKTYIWQDAAWPNWQINLGSLSTSLADVHHAQGHLLGRLNDLGLSDKEKATLVSLTDDVVKTSEIEGEILDPEAVRSSIARRLGIDIGALTPADRRVEGMVEIVLDATENYDQPLSTKRLFTWHRTLFPKDRRTLDNIRSGSWRTDADGPMQVISGAVGHEKVHFQAPPAEYVENEMNEFINWFNENQNLDPLIKSGITHLWFVTIHPFDDGNGRIGRAVCDMVLASSEKSAHRFYSLSAQIQKDRKEYYDQLERTQKGTLDITEWLRWFLEAILRALLNAEKTLDEIITKTQFWQSHIGNTFNSRQINMINKLLDGFQGNLTSKKWATISKCSPDTALRDITELIELRVLAKAASGGRSTHYILTA